MYSSFYGSGVVYWSCYGMNAGRQLVRTCSWKSNWVGEEVAVWIMEECDIAGSLK